jgi:DNA-binding LacI/PurR family transcriptional regulator
MRVTIKDIARETGYSKTTVSFAFNDPTQISATTREKILQTAARLGYVPDPVARSLSRRRMGTIGLLLPQTIPFTLENPYMVELISGIGAACTDAELSLTMIPPTRGSIVASVRGAAVDGLITVGLEPDNEAVQLIHHRHMPFVTIDSQPHEGVPTVVINDRGGAALAMKHLLDAGHRNVAILALEDSSQPDFEEYSGIGLLRMHGYEDALEQAGIDPGSPSVVRIDRPCSVAGGRDAARALVADHPNVTAVAAMSDVQAIGLTAELESLGRKVPDDISVIGFDDIREASLVTPALTTIHQPSRDKGRAAGELLVQMIGKEDPVDSIELPCELVERATVRVLNRNR